MITVYYRKVFPLPGEDTFLFHLKHVDQERRQQILKRKDKKAGWNSLMAGCLLQEVLQQKWGLSTNEEGICAVARNPGGKPFLPEHPDIHFNLSHTQGMVCCAVSDAPVGVDLQKIGMAQERLAQRFFTEEEKEVLSSCTEAERNEIFYRLWSMKESCAKLTGEGIFREISRIEINWQEKTAIRTPEGEKFYFFEQRALPDMAFCVCTESRNHVVTFEEWETPYSGG